MIKRHLFFVISIFFASCARAPLSKIEDAMKPTAKELKVKDTLTKESFFKALIKHLDGMEHSTKINDPMMFGSLKIPLKKYKNFLKEILQHENDYEEWLNQHAILFEVYGKDHPSEVLTTGYYEPIVAGSHQKTSKFSEALYATPNDLLTIDLNKFSRGDKLGTVKGRLENKKVLPYYDRREIYERNIYQGKNLELAWVDPIDAFFIQIQGSGTVEFIEGDKMRIGYAEQNGFSYQPIGKYLTDVIPKEQMSMQKIKAHLQSLNRAEQQIVFNKNPSFVYFKQQAGDALTFSGIEVSEGRTIATDKDFFPKGALAFLDIDEPQFGSADSLEPISWSKKPRLVFDEDTGGAIKGGGHIDLYIGQGDKAAQIAGVMKEIAHLYYLVPKL